jgi:hypothetical protein
MKAGSRLAGDGVGYPERVPYPALPCRKRDATGTRRNYTHQQLQACRGAIWPGPMDRTWA